MSKFSEKDMELIDKNICIVCYGRKERKDIGFAVCPVCKGTGKAFND